MQIGISATLSAVFYAPLFGLASVNEERLDSEKKPTDIRSTKLISNIIAVLFAAGTLFLLNSIFGGSMGLPRLGGYNITNFERLWGIPLALLGTVCGFLFIISSKIFGKFFALIQGKLGIIISTTLGGIILGVMGTYLPLTMFSAYWTENVLKTCFENAPEWMHGFMDGLSLHYYTLPEDDWSHKGSALDFDDAAWYKTLAKAFKLDELIHKHSTIMDKYDPEKKIGLICDEWGTWYDVEPGTNPGFLYQQSTMRDALVAGLSLNIFNKHCDRVKMANIAQLVNVLQAVILTEGPKMLRTPTYHVFHMYKYHQDADLVESYIDGVEQIGEDEKFKVPNLQESASVDKDGVVTITLNNLSIDKAEEVEIAFAECDPARDRCESNSHLFCLINGQVVQGDGHNTVLIHGSGFL